MPIREVVDAFDDHIQNIPFRFIDLYAKPFSFIQRDAVKQKHAAAIESITETDIEQHTSYSNQRREDVIGTIVKGVVKYAVLSHTWQGAGEDYQHMTSPDAVRDGPGWSKLTQFVNLAKHTFKCQFAWADTVCIDPGTPGDRQAAAGSRFDWFRNAYVCIVHLASTHSLLELEHDLWFRRGWTLIDLLAPTRIKFYGAEWEPLNDRCPKAENDKADKNFLDALSKASEIPAGDLRSFVPGTNRVRQKLSWVSKQETTIPEDTAYSLKSILVSRMEIDPGKRGEAFRNFMLHVIPKSRECDVFAWAGSRANGHPAIPSSPACYGTQHRDREFHANRHRYHLSGDRSFSLGDDYLKIRVIFIEVVLERAGKGDHSVKSRSHKSSINRTELRSPLKTGAQMRIGIIDYNGTDEAGKGELRVGECYFGFLLQRSSEQAKWEKVDTEKVVFLESKETKRYKLQVLHLC